LFVEGVASTGKATCVTAPLSLAIVDRLLQRIITGRLFGAERGALGSKVADG